MAMTPFEFRLANVEPFLRTGRPARVLDALADADGAAVTSRQMGDAALGGDHRAALVVLNALFEGGVLARRKRRWTLAPLGTPWPMGSRWLYQARAVDDTMRRFLGQTGTMGGLAQMALPTVSPPEAVRVTAQVLALYGVALPSPAPRRKAARLLHGFSVQLPASADARPWQIGDGIAD